MSKSVRSLIPAIALSLLFCLAGQSNAQFGFGLNKYQKAQQEATQAQYEKGDTQAAIKIWNKVLPKYDEKGWPYTRASILSKIAYLHSQAKDYGKAFKLAEQSEALMDRIEKSGFNKIDDDGMGERPSKKKSQMRLSAQTRQTVYDSIRSTNAAVQMAYYRAAGESDKADAIGQKLTKQSQKQTNVYESTKRQMLDILRAQAKHDKSLTEAEIERRAEKQAREAQKRHDDFQRQQAEKTRLHVEIIQRSRGGDTKVDTLIDSYVTIMLAQDPSGEGMYEANARSFEQYGQTDVAQDYRRLGNHHKESFFKPWGMAIKANMLFEINRPNDALALLDKAYARIKSPPALPRLATDQGRQWAKSMSSFVNMDLIAWTFLRARILTRLNDPRALHEWEKVIAELNKPLPDLSKADPYKKQAVQNAILMRQVILSERYQELAATEIAALHDKIGRKGEGLAYIDQLLKSRETARASFAVEAHKRGYLAANRRLYERFLELSINDPEKNLLGIERAKSRAMVDLMADGIVTMDDPTLRMVAQQRQAAAQDAGMQAAQRKTRNMPSGLNKDLEELKRNNPEFHSLISVDVAGARELSSLLGRDTVAISYYVADDTLFINVLGQGINKVIPLPVSKDALFGAVYDYRQKILNPSAKPSTKSGKVSVDWTIDKGTQRISVKNDMPFPLEIRGISHLIRSYAMGAHFPYLPMGYSMQAPAKARVETIAPGKQAIVFEQEQYRGPWSYCTEIMNFIETNLGTASASGLVFTEAGKDDQLTVYEEHGFTYTPLKNSLYETLIKPVEPFIKGKRLVIVPHSVLHFLPFEALKDGKGKYLVENHPVSYVPSLNALKLCRWKNRRAPRKLVAYGDPLGDLKFAQMEVDAVRKLFADSTVLSGRQVTSRSVASSIGRGDVIHFACHGIFNPASPLESALVMSAPGGGQRNLQSLRMEDLDLLTVSEIMRLRISPSLVFLSACDTGRSRVSGGDELIGLVRGFFVAGSPTLITTLWPIDDQATAMLAVRFYENLLKKNMDKSEALREAKLFVMKKGFKAPYYWAAFVLQGDWK